MVGRTFRRLLFVLAIASLTVSARIFIFSKSKRRFRNYILFLFTYLRNIYFRQINNL